MSIINIARGRFTRPVIAYNEVNNEYLVAWIRHYYSPGDDAMILRDINAQLIANDGTLIGNQITVASETSKQVVLMNPFVKVTYNKAANEYLLIWEYQYSFTDLDIRGRRVAAVLAETEAESA